MGTGPSSPSNLCPVATLVVHTERLCLSDHMASAFRRDSPMGNGEQGSPS